MKKVFYHLFGSLIWAYGLTKLFIFDIDLYLINNYASGFYWVIKYKLFVFIALGLIAWQVFNHKEIWKLIGFSLFYPFILIFWIPLNLTYRKKWFWLFTYISGFIAVITDFKKNIILFFFFSISTILIINSSNRYAIYFACISLASIALYILAKKIYFAFVPSKIFTLDMTMLISKMKDNDFGEKILTQNTTETEEDKNELVTKNEEEKGVEIPQKALNLILANRSLVFISSKLTKFKQTRRYVVFFIISLLFTLIISTVSFGLINFGLYKLDPSFFSISRANGYLMFLYYSFMSVIMNSISAVEPNSSLTILVNISQHLYGILLLVVFGGILISVNTEKYNHEVDQVINSIGEQSIYVENTLERNYEMDMNEAMEKLREIKHNMYDLIALIDKNI